MEAYVVERFEAGASHKTRIGPAGPAQSTLAFPHHQN